MIKLIKLVTNISFFLLTIAFCQVGYASELKFSVDPILPDNQITSEHTYFDLLVKPNQKQTISIHMRNDTEKDVIVEPKINAATTNINGVVEYGKSNSTLDKTAPYNITNLVIPQENEVTIPAKSSYVLKIDIQIPEKEFKGLLVGGITLQEKDVKKDNVTEKNDSAGLAIENKYAYVVAILLRESYEAISQKLLLEKVSPSQVNARNVINATLKNPEATFINQVEINAKVTKKGKKDSLYTSEKKDMQIAPNTTFDYPVPLEGKRLEPGKYTLTMNVKSSKEKWSFTKDFEIKSEVAKSLNDKDVTIKKSNNNWLYILLVLGVFISIFLLFILLKRKKNK